MKVEDIRVCVLRIEGTNCEQEMYDSFKRLGTQPEIVHLKQLTGEVNDTSMKRDLFDYQILFFPGGFSAGDYVRAGAIFGARMKSRLGDQLKEFVSDGYLVGGVCNGFQILVEMGFLPNLHSNEPMTTEPEAVLTTNDSDRFECRPTFLKHVNKGTCAFTKDLVANEVIFSPSAHAEGKFVQPVDKEKELIRELSENDQIVFNYVAPHGLDAGYPWNPNGSPANIAGVCSRDGNVFGMMPHPERAFYMYQHPEWSRLKKLKGIDPYSEGDGAKIFRSAVNYVSRKF